MVHVKLMTLIKLMLTNRKGIIEINLFLPHTVCSREPLLQRRVSGRDDQCAPVSQAVQAAAPDLLRDCPRQHASLVLRPGAQQARRARGDEVGNEGGLHVQCHQRRLLCRGREISAAVENLDRIPPQPGNGLWFSQPQGNIL